MDYAYVPPTGDSDYDKAARAAEGSRPQTTVLSFPATLADFLQTTDALSLTYPADDLLLHAHGDSEGELFVSLDSNNLQQPVVYENLQTVKASGAIKIPPHVLKPSTNFRMLSCLIGSDACLPFLTLLKQALGNPKSVSAPRYLHSYIVAEGSSALEFMQYVFRFVSKTALSRGEVVKKFKEAGNSSDAQFRYVDGTQIPQGNWGKWVPPSWGVFSTTNKFDFPVTLAGPFLTYILDARLKCHAETYTTDPVVFLGASPPANESEALARLQDVLTGGNYDSSHPFPVYKRYHHDSLSDFVASWMWRANGVKGKYDVVHYVGSRCRYELCIPITKPGTDELIYNYYPDSGTPIINFAPNNQPYKLFGVV